MQDDLIQYNAEGKKHGNWEVYWDNGQLKYKGEYIHDKLNGPWIGYHKDGRLWYKQTYDMGKVIGYSLHWNCFSLCSKRFYAR
jgi:antitoxin component YwqK of YwqJK toxin-antitoxin module